jgi:hypothetical protein
MEAAAAAAMAAGAAMAAEWAGTGRWAADFPTAAVSVQRTSAGAHSPKPSATMPPVTPSPQEPPLVNIRIQAIQNTTTTTIGFGEAPIRINTQLDFDPARPFYTTPTKTSS